MDMNNVTAGTAFAGTVRDEVARTVVGQEVVVERVLISLLTGGHLLLEGVPGIWFLGFTAVTSFTNSPPDRDLYGEADR